MKTCPATLEDIADPDNLRMAFLRAAKGKSTSREVVDWRENFNENMAFLRRDILSGGVDFGTFNRFTIHEPKRREIHAPVFRERVLHHALCGLCEPVFERRLVFDSYACRKGNPAGKDFGKCPSV